MSGVVVIGELNVDAVATGLAQEPKLGLEIIAEDFQLTLGSASAIFASGVAKLGHEVTFVSKVGRDDFGNFCLEALRANGVPVRHVLRDPAVKTGITLALSTRRDRALVTYLGSLARTRELDAEILLPGHGEPITDHVALIDDRLAKHERRKEKIHGLIAERPRTGYEIAQAIWGNVAVTQAFLTLSEVIGHADILVNEGRVREADDGEVIRYEEVG